MADLSLLLRKLEEAGEGWSALDFEIWLALNPNDDTVKRWSDKLAEMTLDDRLNWASRFTPCERYTSSVDAAIALVESKAANTPEIGCIITDGVAAWRSAFVIRNEPPSKLALYVVIALLKALEPARPLEAREG